MACIVAATVLRDYVIELTFRDGLVKEVDLEPQLHGRLFGELRDPIIFRQVRVDPDACTIVWPNGADICPDLLHDDLEPA